MFWGELHCRNCDYCSEDFICMPHWNSWVHGVLIQDVQSKALRVFWPSDDDPRGILDLPAEEVATHFERRRAEAVSKELRPGERGVEVEEFLLRKPTTTLPCPGCGELLLWETTGIS